jgi:hypothetical protein
MADPIPINKQPKPVAPFREIGGTGLKVASGFLYEEFQQEISGTQGVRLFKEMSVNSAVLGAIIYTIEQMVQQVEWNIEPFDDQPASKDPKEFIEQCLFEDMNVSWSDTLSEITSFLIYGWAWFEVVYKMRNGVDSDPPSKFNDHKVGWRKWAIRGQETLWMWNFDENGGLEGMTQQLIWPQFEQVTIPIEKSLLFRTRIEKNNPEGQSIFRRAYPAYWRSKRLEDIEGIGIERDLAGLPVLTPPEDLNIWNPQDGDMITALAAAKNLVQSVRRGEREGVIKPFGWTLELLASPSRRQFDIDATIQRYDTRQAMTCLADFLFLGHQASGRGSYALSSDKTRMFTLALAGFLRRITDVINRHAIPVLLQLNGMDSTQSPKLAHGDIEVQDLQRLGQYLTVLGNIGAISFPDDELERYLRQVADLPEPSTEPLPPEPPRAPTQIPPPGRASNLPPGQPRPPRRPRTQAQPPPPPRQ